jgi:hypothetical protein
MQDRKFKVLIATFSYAGNSGFKAEHPSVGRWIARTIVRAKEDPRVLSIADREFGDTPVTMARNAAAYHAVKHGYDVLVMIDSDSIADLYLGSDKEAKAFWDSSFDFFVKHYDKGPCNIFAPYCGQPPHPVHGGEENCFVFDWQTLNNNQNRRHYKLEAFSRNHAAISRGIQEVAAGPTGLILIDTRVFGRLPQPWFDYEWENDGPQCPHCGQNKPGPRIAKSTTEDIFFTRNCFYLKIPQFCNWDAWVGHYKPEIVGRPTVLHYDAVRQELRDAIEQHIAHDDRIREVNPGMSMDEITRGLGIVPGTLRAMPPQMPAPSVATETPAVEPPRACGNATFTSGCVATDTATVDCIASYPGSGNGRPH